MVKKRKWRKIYIFASLAVVLIICWSMVWLFTAIPVQIATATANRYMQETYPAFHYEEPYVSTTFVSTSGNSIFSCRIPSSYTAVYHNTEDETQYQRIDIYPACLPFWIDDTGTVYIP